MLISPAISVIIPVYQAEAFLNETVRSVEASAFSDFEIVLVDDGSKDGSLKLCEELCGQYENIRVFSQENKGAAAARNHGIRKARGEYVCFVDSDDKIRPTMLGTLYRVRKEEEAAGRRTFLVQIGREEITETGEILSAAVACPETDRFLTAEETFERLLLHEGDSSLCTVLGSRAFFLEHPFAEGTTCEDFILYRTLIDAMEGVRLVPEIGYQVVHRMESLTRKTTADYFSPVYRRIVEEADLVEQEVVPAHPGLKKSARRFGLYMRMEYLLHIPIAMMENKTHPENTFYRTVVRYLRSHIKDTLTIPHLTAKNRIYLLLFTAAPLTVRKAHRLAMRRRGR